MVVGAICGLFYTVDFFAPSPGLVRGSDVNGELVAKPVFDADSAIEGYFDLVRSSDNPIFSDFEPIEPEAESALEPHTGELASTAEATVSDLDLISIKYGDSLSSIFARHNFPATDLRAILKNDHPSRPLRRIVVGEQIAFTKDALGLLESFTYVPNQEERFVYSRTPNGFQNEHIEAIREYKTVYKYVVIERGESPITAGLRVGIQNEETILQLTRLLQWSIDFWLDIRPNDNFKVLYKELYLDGKYAKDAHILAAEFQTRRATHRLLRYEKEGVFHGYFNPDGSTMRRQFLRAPLDYVRVSSEFSPRRLHPVIKQYRPHNGVDYAAPTGTPVRATGDGVVKKTGYTTPNGNYIFLTHPPHFETRYLHFSKVAKGMKKGVAVKQGQVIGYVGSTGYSTGPHLHYEFLINGRHQNPKTIESPEEVISSPDDLATFKQNTAHLIEQFDQAHVTYLQQNLGNLQAHN